MIVAGCDIGSLSAKAVIMKDGAILSSSVIFAKPDPEESANEVIGLSLKSAGLNMKDLNFVLATGYGRNSIAVANKSESEISCHGKGAHWRNSHVRMVIDIGGQDAKAIRLDSAGNVIRYAYNDKCASGTGRFLEVMAAAMGLEIEKLGEISAQSTAPVSLSNQCVVFAETEIVSLINAGKELKDIVAGLHKSLANRVAALARSLELDREIVMTGGVAKNPGMFSALEEALGAKMLHLDLDPQINGAVGAALLAAEYANGKKS
jgi:predicted CoA-substrate-specific enzyme activase